MNEKQAVIGIIGGMGPMATVDLFRKMIKCTDAACDQEHLHVLIDNDPHVPDRTESIRTGSEVPLEYLRRSALRLQTAGAELLTIACNTSYYYYDKLCQTPELHIPVLHMPLEAAFEAKKRGIKRAGLLATDGTLLSGSYDRAFAQVGIELMKPDTEGQKALMDIIYNQVKLGRTIDLSKLSPALTRMQTDGCEVFVLACTELPIAFAGTDSWRLLDATTVMARAAVKAAGGKLKSEFCHAQ